jgi:hypothetical protein
MRSPNPALDGRLPALPHAPLSIATRILDHNFSNSLLMTVILNTISAT